MIKNIVFDMADVILSCDPLDYIRMLDIDHSKDEVLRRAAVDPELFLAIDQGRMRDMEEGIDEYKRHAPDLCPELDAFIAGPWREYTFVPMEGMPEVVQRLKDKGFRVFMITNFGTTDMDFVRERHHFE